MSKLSRTASSTLILIGVLLQALPLLAFDQVVGIGGIRIRILVNADAVAALPLDPVQDPTLRPYVTAAIEQVTGCLVRPGSFVQDTHVIYARLDCPPARARSLRSQSSGNGRGGFAGLTELPLD